MFRRVLTAFLAALIITPALAAPEVNPSDRVSRNVVVRAQPDGDAAVVGGLFPGDEAELLEHVACQLASWVAISVGIPGEGTAR